VVRVEDIVHDPKGSDDYANIVALNETKNILTLSRLSDPIY
jgi:hypothetical protein